MIELNLLPKELRKKKPDLVFPIIHAFFGDSPSANLDSEIAVFKEQCYQKREMLKEKYRPAIPLAASKPEKVAVIGSGPAGLAAAWSLARKG